MVQVHATSAHAWRCTSGAFVHAKQYTHGTCTATGVHACNRGTCLQQGHMHATGVHACNRGTKHKLVYLHRHEAALRQARRSMEKQSAAKQQAYEALHEVQVS